jgi:hypothetical protein
VKTIASSNYNIIAGLFSMHTQFCRYKFNIDINKLGLSCAKLRISQARLG